ncbi:hypothetical protein KO566_00015 [Flavobacteriaceae bacterium XHP0103]|uniref:hypothetical protein n=1 Tax=Marixanthotalea marina TaxID=2844359 RepID=UPI002989D86E|nr:hypothetical protein [Marixanthotalea marina]MBU3820428.1 hypothetical protein [Marixanthotalea marina]
MNKKRYVISINQFANFYKGTESVKKRIIRQQKEPNKFLVAWYQLPKSRIKKSIENNCDLEPILKGIEELKLRQPQKPRQVLDRAVSLEALNRYVNIKLPDLLKSVPYEIIKNVEFNSITIKGVEIIISPDVIFRLKANGKTYLGAVKVHISKSNVFDNIQSRYISSLLHKYLKEVVAQADEEVLEDLCLSIDVFGEKVISVPKNLSKSLLEIEVICEEVKSIWNVA